MATKKKKPRVKIKYRQTSTLLKCVILTAIVFSTVALLVLRNATLTEKKRYETLRKDAAFELSRRDKLQEYVASHGTVEDIKRYAEVVLGLVDPDTVYFEVVPKD